MPTTRARRAPRVRDALAAGGVVLRGAGEEIEVVIAGRDSDRTWVFPKGTPDPGESREQTAIREVEEETGLRVRITGPLDSIEYWFVQSGTRIHKTVHYFLMEPVGGDLAGHDHEFDEVRWIPFDQAATMLTFETERAHFANDATFGAAANDAQPVTPALQFDDCLLRAGHRQSGLLAVVLHPKSVGCIPLLFWKSHRFVDGIPVWRISRLIDLAIEVKSKFGERPLKGDQPELRGVNQRSVPIKKQSRD